MGASPCGYCGFVPANIGGPASAYRHGAFPYAGPSAAAQRSAVGRRSTRWLPRTRLGLLLTALGLFVSWTPFVAALGALFLSLGSTLLFLNARGAGRKHEIAVVAAFFLLAVGGVAIGVLLGAFLLQAYDAAYAGLALSTLRGPANLLVWATLPAMIAVTTGLALQVVFLLPPRRRPLLLWMCMALAATAALATWLSAPEVLTLGAARVRASSVTDFLFRLSVWRMVEAPAYLGLGILYAKACAEVSSPSPAAKSPSPEA